MTKNILGAVSLSVSLLFASSPLLAAGNIEAGKEKSKVCMACHMADGNSINPEWPKIAGQIPSYVVKQLQDFKSGKRVNQIMEPILAPLSQQDIEDLAAYFATQQVAPGSGNSELLLAGEKLYNKGIFYTTVTACTGCHGAKGNGNAAWEKNLAAPPTVLAPAIAGQHATYTANQLKAFRSGERSNDVGGVMQKIVDKLTDEQIEAVSAYIASLGGV
ncbi:MAG: c-type cytochrome [Candidatus Thiodiazotropha sp.]